MQPDDDVAAAARLALVVEGCMPNDKARAALESLPGAKVVRRVLAALRDNTNEEEEQDDDNKEEQGNNNGEDGFVITQDNVTKDNKTLHWSPQLGRMRQTTTAALASMT
jgi:hypothetical protein